MAEPVRATAYTFYVSVIDSADSTSFKLNPTIAAGDFKVSTDGSTFANLSTLPVVTPSGSIAILVSLSVLEMTGDKIVVRGIDVAGAEWDDIMIFVDVPTALPLDILEGDHIETRTTSRVNKKGTTTAVLDKAVSGSLLSDGVTITTVDN